jgi:hypothetical protein
MNKLFQLFGIAIICNACSSNQQNNTEKNKFLSDRIKFEQRQKKFYDDEKKASIREDKRREAERNKSEKEKIKRGYKRFRI